MKPCPECGSVACALSSPAVCRHTGRPRGGTNKGMTAGPPKDTAIKAAPVNK